MPDRAREFGASITAGSLSGTAATYGRRSSDHMRLIQDRVRLQVRAFVFDLDGVIAWTEGFHYASLNAYLADFGCALTRDQFKQLVGKDTATAANMVTQWLSLPISPEQLTEGRLNRIRPFLLRDLEPTPGLLPLLRFLHDRGMSLAVASNSPRAYVEDVIDLLDLSDRFRCVRAGEDVSRGKPAPDLYLCVSECLGIATDQCVAVEDSPAGVQSAKESGMISVAVPNALLQGEDFPLADLCFTSLTELLGWLRSVLQGDTVG